MKFNSSILTLQLLTIITLCSIQYTFSQETGEDKWGAWYMYFGTNRVSDKLSIHTEAQFRFYEVTSTFNQLLLRTGLNYHINDNAIATIGYGYINTDGSFEDIEGEENSDEHRIFEQFILKNEVGKFKFEHRYRLEQRFISTQLDDFTEHRARYRLQLTYPIDERWFLNVYDEVFINLQEPIFGQNRLYGALGYHIKSNFSIQLGYLKNHFTGINFDRLQLGVFFNTDFRKDK
ncbi:DUF2490 domain-containing protein [Aquimarina sp. MMG016]|uniref:DUF2490 domain-containing protein n=1 Tax=Aquimarina sp. MMG016 TaxID=2822690 RepID=UPI001B3A7454|nr:DUF2490 domain-containing protein [Aquimarina sp. MMG016]MBQ4822769.1 DUF2490 domain-containing protein [Aquimarina sp. MMG016]